MTDATETDFDCIMSVLERRDVKVNIHYHNTNTAYKAVFPVKQKDSFSLGIAFDLDGKFLTLVSEFFLLPNPTEMQ